MRLSKLGYYADFFVGLLLIVVSAGVATFDTRSNGAKWLLCVGLGAAARTMIGYMIHRWIYHQVPYFRGLHEAHHAEPGADFGSPPMIGVVIIFMVFYAPVATTSFVIASGLTTGVLAGCSVYMLVHHADHRWTPAPTAWLFRAHRQHALHHHHSDLCNFGITTSFWDLLFGTTGAIGRGNVDHRRPDRD
jgi:sterol desaturase/sphingolipid hydroxylase (fatty acid hydroxylase superfamily)